MIHLNNVSFNYPGSSKVVLNDISVSLEPGHIYGLLGKNGVGKSTLFRLISGLNRVKSGTIQTLSANPADRLPSMLSEIFLLPEEIHFPKMSVIAYAELYGRFYPRFSMAELNTVIDDFEVDRKQPLQSMSQGQRKKAYMAFALACNTKILLMDEPTNSLDIPSKTVFRRILDSHRNKDRLVIISTHQVRDLEQLIDAVIILENQDIRMCETAETLLNRYHFGDIEDPADAIYCEETVRGNVGIKLRKTDPVQPLKALDLETLFNAVMSNRDAFK